MPFSTKATLIAFQADVEHYPCHAKLSIGDTVTFDGAELKGEMCPHVMPQIANALYTLFLAGPRYVNPGYYNLFWYACGSSADPSKECFDGNGWNPVNKEFVTSPYHVSCLQDPRAFRWPPNETRDVMKDVCIVCPDTRTAAVFKAEPYDLATAGSELPYTRREITILDRVNKAGGPFPINQILSLFSEKERLEIYPPLSPVIIGAMLEELEALHFIKLARGQVSATETGAARVALYKTEIPAGHAKALGLYD
ncbi:MAG: hypothetical protein FWG03_02400 [Clostridiales bacterium]|nr:hypothetical protein [Clostridiales bacterium]